MLGITERTEIRKISDDPRVVAAAELLRTLEVDLKSVVAGLRRCTGSPIGSGEPSIRHDPSDDVEALLAGTPTSTLSAPVAESEWHSLQRQRRALESAIPAAKHRLQRIRCEAELSEIARLSPTLKESYGNFLDSLEATLFHLREHHELLTRMHRAGIAHDSLGVTWQLTPRESVMLHGGSDSHLEFYIKTRRQATGIHDEGASK